MESKIQKEENSNSMLRAALHSIGYAGSKDSQMVPSVFENKPCVEEENEEELVEEEKTVEKKEKTDEEIIDQAKFTVASMSDTV